MNVPGRRTRRRPGFRSFSHGETIFRSLLSVVHHIQVVIVIAKDGVAVVNGHAAQGVGVARCAPDLATGRAVKAVAVAGALLGVGVEVQVVGAGAVAHHHDGALNGEAIALDHRFHGRAVGTGRRRH